MADRVCWPLFAYVAHFLFFLWMSEFEPRELAMTSRRATDLATHALQLSHPALYVANHSFT
jgi:hypothetical protein